MQGSFVKRRVEAAQVGWSDSLRTVRFQRLEADLGTTLLTRAVIGKARQPTWAGPVPDCCTTSNATTSAR